MKRRTFIVSSGAACVSSVLFRDALAQPAAKSPSESFSWQGGGLQFNFSVADGRLRQHLFLPSATEVPHDSLQWSGVEVGVLCTGEDSPDSGMKQSGGSPGARLKFATKDELQSEKGKTLILKHADTMLNLDVQSYYEAFEDLPVVRRYVEISNTGMQPVGIEYLSSAMLHGLADPVHYDDELRIWLAYNSWMAEGQW